MNSADVSTGNDGTASQYNNLRKDVRLAVKDPVSDADASTITFDMGASGGCIHKTTLGGNRVLAVSNLVAGQSFRLIITQDGTGSRIPTWFVSPGAGTHAIKWVASTPPTPSTAAGKTDIFDFYYDGVDIFGTIVGLNFG